MEKLVSVIVPVYNNEKSVGKTIDSICNQTYKNLEILLVNDGSTDNTLEVLKEYQEKDSRIKVLSQKNSGPGEARNYGLREMQGDLVTFVDADDIIGEEIIEKLVKVQEQENADVVRYNFYYSTEDNLKEQRGNLLNLNNCKFEDKEIKEKIIPYFIKNELCSFVWLLFLTRDAVQNIYFDTNTNYMEDTLFYIDLLYKIKSIYFIDEAEYFYYYTPQKNQDNLKFVLKYIKSLNYVYGELAKKLEKNENEKSSKCVCLNLKWLNTIVDYITIILRVEPKMSFEEWKNIVKELNYKKEYDFELLHVTKYNEIAIKLLAKGKLRTLYNFTKFRNFLKKKLG